MRSDAVLAWLALGAVAVSGIACSSSAPPSTSGTTQPPAFTDTTGETANQPAEYPAGPFGVSVGSIIENFQFVGYQDPKTNHATMQLIQLSDFYNPHGKDPSYQPPAGGQDDRYFPTTSGYENAGKLKPTVLLVDVASVWCGPCNDEAGTVLPMKHALYEPCGGEFLLQLADSENPGTPATPKNLLQWTEKYGVDFPGAIDPTYKLQELWAANAFPENFIIDTTTMKIVDVIAGEAVVGTCAEYSVCNVDADCQVCGPDPSGGPSNVCGDGTDCTASTQCAGQKCTPFPFWVKYESLLDKTRAGCTVK
jgi:hypothetical protein